MSLDDRQRAALLEAFAGPGSLRLTRLGRLLLTKAPLAQREYGADGETGSVLMNETVTRMLDPESRMGETWDPSARSAERQIERKMRELASGAADRWKRRGSHVSLSERQEDQDGNEGLELSEMLSTDPSDNPKGGDFSGSEKRAIARLDAGPHYRELLKQIVCGDGKDWAPVRSAEMTDEEFEAAEAADPEDLFSEQVRAQTILRLLAVGFRPAEVASHFPASNVEAVDRRLRRAVSELDRDGFKEWPRGHAEASEERIRSWRSA